MPIWLAFYTGVFIATGVLAAQVLKSGPPRKFPITTARPKLAARRLTKQHIQR